MFIKDEIHWMKAESVSLVKFNLQVGYRFEYLEEKNRIRMVKARINLTLHLCVIV